VAWVVKLTAHLHLVPKSKNAWSYTSTPQYASMALCSVKKKHRDNFTFTHAYYMPRPFHLSLYNYTVDHY